jgi:hypothetical protein
MEIEIVEFYETFRDQEKRQLKGTLHVYLIDLNADLRGVRICKEKKKWFVNLPSGWATDEETKERIQYPYFSFMDREKTVALRNLIREKGIPFVKEKVGEPFFKPD